MSCQKAEHASAHHLSEAGKGEVIPLYDDDEQVRASGSVKAGVRDLSRWVRFQLAEGTWDGKPLVSKENLLETRTPQIVVPVPGLLKREAGTTQASYGLGWHVEDYRGHTLISHGGAVDGFRARITLVPRAKLAVVVLANLDVSEMPAALSFALLDRMLGLPNKDWNAPYAAQREKERALAREAEKARQASRRKGTKPSRELAAYAGTYRHPAYGVARVSVEKGRLVLAWGRSRLPLEHFHFDTFTGLPPDRLAGRVATFTLGADGTPARLRFLGQDFRRDKQ